MKKKIYITNAQFQRKCQDLSDKGKSEKQIMKLMSKYTLSKKEREIMEQNYYEAKMCAEHDW